MKFDSYHPMINLIYFTAAAASALCFDHPAMVAISYISAFAYSVKLRGKKNLWFNLSLIPLVLLYAWWYSFYNHFGVTNLGRNFAGNQLTLEALVYGFQSGFSMAAVIMIFSCLLAVFSADKAVYLFGRISPKLSLFISILLRTGPRVGEYAGRINRGQKGIGTAPSQGNILRRIINSLRLISALITWMLEGFVESSQSMKCRGYSLKGRTAFSIYRFDNRDRSLVVAIVFLLTVVIAGWALDQTNIYYDPQIIMMPVTPLSYMVYSAYAAMLLLPMTVQIIGERKFEKLR